jgi:hypothetical protein
MISAVPGVMRPAKNTAHFAFDFLRKESVCVRSQVASPDGLAPLAPASADGPPRGLGSVGARLCRHSREGLRMTKRRSPRTRARSALRARAKGGRRQIAHQHQPRPNSKKARVLGLLSAPNGTTIATIMRSTGWQPHTVRGFLTAVVRKKLGLRLESEKAKSERVYRIVSGGTSEAVGEPGA